MNSPSRVIESRAWRRPALTLLVLSAVLLLQRHHLAELPAALRQLGHAQPAWILVGITASAVTYAMAAWAMTGTVHHPVPYGAALRVQVASGLTTLAAPAGLGSAGLNVWFFERSGIPRREAVAAAVRNGAAGGAVHLVGLTMVAWQLPQLIDVDAGQVRGLSIVVGALVAAASAAATIAAFLWPEHRRSALAMAADVGRSTAGLLRRRDRATPLLGGSVGLSLAYGVCLWACAQAVGIPLDLPTAVALELVVQALGAVSATPGGVGVVEVAALQGLLLIGADPAAALAVVLLHRLLTFWLPVLPGALALRSLRGLTVLKEPVAA